MPTNPPRRRPVGPPAVHVDGLRPPAAVLRRGLLGGMAAGALLGALAVVPDSLEAQLAPEPGTAYPVTWSTLVVAMPVGALVAFLPALLAVAVWQWQLPKGPRRARVAGSAAAALAVVLTVVVLVVTSSGPGASAWDVDGLALTAVAGLVSYVIAYLAVPLVTTRRRRGR